MARRPYSPVKPNFEPVELTLSLRSKTRDRSQEGDIVNIRPLIINRTGVDLTKRYLLVPVEGFDHWEFRDTPICEGMANIDRHWAIEGKDRFTIKHYDKRRFCIPLHRLKLVYPALDLDRCRDMDDSYQPFRHFCQDRGYFIETIKPFYYHGLIFDKWTGRYL